MKIKYLGVSSLAISLLLTGCSQEADNKTSKQEQVQKKDKKVSKSDENKEKDNVSKKEKSKASQNTSEVNNSEINTSEVNTSQNVNEKSTNEYLPNNSTANIANYSNNRPETQAEANQRLQEESRSEHNGLSNAEYAMKIFNEASNKENPNPYQGATKGSDGHYYSPGGTDLGNPEAGGSTPTVGADSDPNQRAFNPDLDE